MSVENPFVRHLSRGAASAPQNPVFTDTPLTTGDAAAPSDNPFAALAQGSTNQPVPADDVPEPEPESLPAANPAPKKRAPRKAKVQPDTEPSEEADDLSEIVLTLSPPAAWEALTDIIEHSSSAVEKLKSDADTLANVVNADKEAIESDIAALQLKLNALVRKKEEIERNEVEAVSQLAKMKETADSLTARVKQAENHRNSAVESILSAVHNKSGTYGSIRVTVVSGVAHIEKV